MTRPLSDDPLAAVPEAGPDVLTLLLLQHRRLEALLRSRVLGVRPADRRRTLPPVLDAFAAGLGAEAAVFHPALRALAPPVDPPDDVHHRLCDLAGRLRHLDPDSPEAAQACLDLLDTAIAHHRQQERTAFPLVARALSMGQREVLGARVAAAEAALRTLRPPAGGDDVAPARVGPG